MRKYRVYKYGLELSLGEKQVLSVLSDRLGMSRSRILRTALAVVWRHYCKNPEELKIVLEESPYE